MLNKTKIIFCCLFLVFFHIGVNGFSQKKISVHASQLPLDLILNDVAAKNNIRFAFDDDLLSNIETSFQFETILLEDFLETICNQFGLNYKLISGTYVFYVDNQMKMMEAFTKPLIETEIVYDDFELPEPTIREFTIRGIVKSSKTGSKLKYCSLLINGEESAITNEMGFFSKTLDSDGEVLIQINHLGYRSLDTLLVIQSTTPFDLQLKPNPHIQSIQLMQRKKVNTVKFMVELPQVSYMIAFNPKTTPQIPSIEPNDLVNALTVIPGINYLKGTDTGLSIRGGSPSDNLVLIDGIPIIETSHLMGNLSVLNSKYIQQAFVSRGGFGAEYGGRTAGIVDLTGKTGNGEVAVVDFTANLLHTNIYVGLPITEKSSIAGSFKKSFVDVWPSYLIDNFALENKIIESDDELPSIGYVEQTIVNYSDANLKLSIRPTDHKEITFNILNSVDDQNRQYGFPLEGEYYQKNETESQSTGYSFNVKSQSRGGWLNAFSMGYNNLSSSSSSENGKTAEQSDLLVKPFYNTDEIDLKELRGTWKSEIRKKRLTYKFGVGFNANTLDYRYEDREVVVTGANNFNDSISSVADVQFINAYYQMEVSPWKWIRLRAGLRALYDSNNDLINLQPRYGIQLMPFSKLKFYYSGGRYLQYLYLTNRIDSYKNVSSIWFIPENRQQNLEAFHHIAGLRLQQKKVLLNLEAYSKKNSHKVYFLGEKTTQNGLDIVDYSQLLGEEINRGVDIFFQYQTSIFKQLISYSFSLPVERIEGLNNNDYFPSFDHQDHRLRLTEIATWNGWTASVNWYYASGGAYLLNSSTNTQLDFGRNNDFMQLDVSMVKQFSFNSFNLDIGVTVLNLLDKSNEIAVRNFIVPEGYDEHTIKMTTTATSFSPLFYINLRYE